MAALQIRVPIQDGAHINLYAMAALDRRAAQELFESIEELENRK